MRVRTKDPPVALDNLKENISGIELGFIYIWFVSTIELIVDLLRGVRTANEKWASPPD